MAEGPRDDNGGFIIFRDGYAPVFGGLPALFVNWLLALSKVTDAIFITYADDGAVPD